jgi:hypothetical protein
VKRAETEAKKTKGDEEITTVEGGEKEEKEEEEEKEVDPTLTPNVPPVVPSTPRAMRLAHTLPPPPTQPLQGAKRKAPQELKKAPATETLKTYFVTCVGDWRCGSRGWVNMRTWLRCRSERHTCSTDAESSSAAHQVQKEGPGIEKRKTWAKMFGDWQCACGCWNRKHWQHCNKCKREKARCRAAQDWDESLEPQPDHSYPARNGFWNGGEPHLESTGGGTSAGARRRENAEHWGVKRRYQEPKNKYRER